MIEIINIRKKYKNRYVLNDINLSLPRKGLIIINGPSGCGKTTLLNALSTLLDSEGEIIFDHRHYSLMSESEKEYLRSQKIGFVFQDYKLFEFETVKENISLTIDIASYDKKSKKDKRIKDLLNLVGLSKKENEFVSNLSGGEKQRAAICRALANSPSVVLADEPTGNLDENNTKNIMDLLRKISSFTLVIMVSHDEQITNEYADQIIKMRDGIIIDKINQNIDEAHQRLPLLKLNNKSSNRLLPNNFLIKHTFGLIKRRKWRSLFITIVTSLGLIGVGLASTLSNIISTNLYRSYSSILDDDRLIMSPKTIGSEKDVITSMSYDDVMDIYSQNSSDISHVGVYYANDFDQMFTYNNVALDCSGVRKPLNGLSIKLVNEFALLDEEDVIPDSISLLDNNELVLSGPFSLVNEICYQLQIERTMDSFSHYLEHNDLYLSFMLENTNWSYFMDFSIKLSGFILSNHTLFYHTNPIWNEYILETKLALPTTSKLNVASEHPWDLRKGYYLDFNYHRDEFLTNYRFDYDKQNVDFEILDRKYYPNLFRGEETIECPRLLAVNRTKKDVLPSYIGGFCRTANQKVKKIIYGTQTGYAIYDKNLMIGFARNAYLSTNESNIEDVIDLLSYIKYEDAQKVKLPKGTLEGHFSKSNIEGFVFEPSYSLISGRDPVDYQEIVVSSALAEKLNISNPINTSIYFTFPVLESLLSNGYVNRDFKTISLKIVGISNSAKLALHHFEPWSVLFFQTMLGMSTFELNIENLSIQIDKTYEQEIIADLERAFPQNEISSPLQGVRSSVDQICHYVELILLIVSITSVIIASLILLICNYLHFIEAKKDIGLVRCLGVNKNESRKFIYAHSLIMTLFSLFLSIIELLIISMILSKVMSDSLHITQTFVFNPMSIVYMLIVDFVIMFIGSALVSLKIKKYTPLECLTA